MTLVEVLAFVETGLRFSLVTTTASDSEVESLGRLYRSLPGTPQGS